jgi:hypothetical protein
MITLRFLVFVLMCFVFFVFLISGLRLWYYDIHEMFGISNEIKGTLSELVENKCSEVKGYKLDSNNFKKINDNIIIPIQSYVDKVIKNKNGVCVINDPDLTVTKECPTINCIGVDQKSRLVKGDIIEDKVMGAGLSTGEDGYCEYNNCIGFCNRVDDLCYTFVPEKNQFVQQKERMDCTPETLNTGHCLKKPDAELCPDKLVQKYNSNNELEHIILTKTLDENNRCIYSPVGIEHPFFETEKEAKDCCGTKPETSLCYYKKQLSNNDIYYYEKNHKLLKPSCEYENLDSVNCLSNLDGECKSNQKYFRYRETNKIDEDSVIVHYDTVDKKQYLSPLDRLSGIQKCITPVNYPPVGYSHGINCSMLCYRVDGTSNVINGTITEGEDGEDGVECKLTGIGSCFNQYDTHNWIKHNPSGKRFTYPGYSSNTNPEYKKWKQQPIDDTSWTFDVDWCLDPANIDTATCKYNEELIHNYTQLLEAPRPGYPVGDTPYYAASSASSSASEAESTSDDASSSAASSVSEAEFAAELEANSPNEAEISLGGVESVMLNIGHTSSDSFEYTIVDQSDNNDFQSPIEYRIYMYIPPEIEMTFTDPFQNNLSGTVTNMNPATSYKVFVRKFYSESDNTREHIDSEHRPVNTAAIGGKTQPTPPSLGVVTNYTNNSRVTYFPNSNGDASSAVLHFYSKQSSDGEWREYINAAKNVLNDSTMSVFTFDDLEPDTLYTLMIDKKTDFPDEFKVLIPIKTLPINNNNNNNNPDPNQPNVFSQNILDILKSEPGNIVQKIRRVLLNKTKSPQNGIQPVRPSSVGEQYSRITNNNTNNRELTPMNSGQTNLFSTNQTPLILEAKPLNQNYNSYHNQPPKVIQPTTTKMRHDEFDKIVTHQRLWNDNGL